MRPLWSFLLPRYVAGTLPAFAARFVAAALHDDPELAAAYDALRAAERVASLRSISVAQKNAIEAQLFGADTHAAHGARGAHEAHGAHGAHGAPRRARFGVVLPLVAATAAALCFVVVREPTPAYGVGDLEGRGARIAADPVGVKVTCLDRAGTSSIGSATAGARRAMDALQCPASSLMAFSTTNLGKEMRHLFVVGVAADGSRRWYAPFTPGTSAVAVAPGVVDDVLSSVADTANMPVGPVTLFVLVSDEPFSADDVEHALSSGERSGIAIGRVDRLPLDFVPLQARIDVTP